MKNKLVQLSTEIVKVDLIEIKDKIPVANTEAVDAYILELTAYVDESIKNDLDVEVVESKIKEIKDTHDGFTDFRKSFTAPLTGIVKEFTSRESKIDEQRDRLIERKKEMLEFTYEIADEAIRLEFERLQEESNNITPDMTVFDSFVSKQREVKGMLPNDKNVLGKASLEKIEKEFEKHVAPIREAQRLEELRASEQKQFEMYLENLNVSSNNINELDAVIINLTKMKEVIPDFYPNIIEQCTRTLDNKIGLARGNINTLKALEAQAEAEATAKQAEAKVEELHDADDEIITELNNIENGLSIISDDKKMLNTQLDRLRALFKSIKYAETQNLAKDVAEKIKLMIIDIDTKSKTEDKEIVSETFTVHGTVDDMKALVKFLKERGMSYE